MKSWTRLQILGPLIHCYEQDYILGKRLRDRNGYNGDSFVIRTTKISYEVRSGYLSTNNSLRIRNYEPSFMGYPWKSVMRGRQMEVTKDLHRNGYGGSGARKEIYISSHAPQYGRVSRSCVVLFVLVVLAVSVVLVAYTVLRCGGCCPTSPHPFP